jgi:hypothetical protein
MIWRNVKLLVAQDFVLLKYTTDKLLLGIDFCKIYSFCWSVDCTRRVLTFVVSFHKQDSFQYLKII